MIFFRCPSWTSRLIRWHYKPMGFTYPIPDRWRMCTISYSIPRWRTPISCGQCRSSNMIYYAEMHRQTFEKLTWLKGTYYTENPSIRFMFVTFQYYCICWISKLPRLKRKRMRSIIPTAHNSDSPLLRQPIIPTAHYSDGPFFR